MTAAVDVDSLPPTQYLILEVLAARHRLDEPFWTFSTRFRRTAEALADAGLVSWQSGVEPKTIQVRLSDAGRRAVMVDAHMSPLSRAEALRAAATGGGPCPTCTRPFYTHVCLSCSPDSQTPGAGCINCRNTGMDQTPCLPPRSAR